MPAERSPRRRWPLLLPLLTAHAFAAAAPVPFFASYGGTANIAEVIDPNVPVVRFETAMSGNGSFSLDDYFSTDVVDLSTGAGSGTQRFVAANGDQLFGAFFVQIVPSLTTPGALDLFGNTTFTGGTGSFHGATGAATFTGSGQFTSPTSAQAAFRFAGTLEFVPEPGTWALLVGALAAAIAFNPRRQGA